MAQTPEVSPTMTVRPDDAMPGSRRHRLMVLVAVAALAGAIAGLAGVYGIGAITRNAAGDAACRAALDAAGRIAPLARGEVAAVSVAGRPKPVPELSFLDRSGQPKALAEWRG